MKLVKTVRNFSRREQFVVWGGRRHTVPPLGTATVKTEIADALIRERHPLVKAVEEVDSYFDPEWTGKRVWLYNATGNLDLPEKITIHPIINKRRTPVEIDNPHRNPKLVIHRYDRGQRRRTDGGEGFESMGSIDIEFYPYTRLAIPKHIADWVLARDSMVQNPGEIKRSKEPGFEPDDTWSYEDVCNYARVLGISCRKEIAIRNTVKRGDYGVATADEVVDEEKLSLLHRIFFATSHPHTPEVTKEQYESLLAGFKQEDMKEERDQKRSPKPPPKKGKPGVEFTLADDKPKQEHSTSAFVG